MKALKVRRIVYSLGVLLCFFKLASAESGLEAVSEGSLLSAPILKVKPSSCVALHRGQLCFQEVRLNWQSAERRHLCLFNTSQNTPLVCSSGTSGEHSHQYSSTSSETYVLRDGEFGAVVASVSVSTAWVYRTGRRSSSGWRLF